MSDFVPFFDADDFRPVDKSPAPELATPTPTCIVCKDAPGTLTAFIESPRAGAKHYFPCCMRCFFAAGTPEGKTRVWDAAVDDAVALAVAKVGGSA